METVTQIIRLTLPNQVLAIIDSRSQNQGMSRDAVIADIVSGLTVASYKESSAIPQGQRIDAQLALPEEIWTLIGDLSLSSQQPKTRFVSHYICQALGVSLSPSGEQYDVVKMKGLTDEGIANLTSKLNEIKNNEHVTVMGVSGDEHAVPEFYAVIAKEHTEDITKQLKTLGFQPNTLRPHEAKPLLDAYLQSF